MVSIRRPFGVCMRQPSTVPRLFIRYDEYNTQCSAQPLTYEKKHRSLRLRGCDAHTYVRACRCHCWRPSSRDETRDARSVESACRRESAAAQKKHLGKCSAPSRRRSLRSQSSCARPYLTTASWGSRCGARDRSRIPPHKTLPPLPPRSLTLLLARTGRRLPRPCVLVICSGGP